MTDIGEGVVTAPSATPPTAAQTIEVRNLTKRYRSVTAVDDLSFTVTPGRVTGFLGPNGAGKTTTLRILLGLVTPTAGTATIGGRAYHELERPTRLVGAALEASSFHPGRSGRNHLRTVAAPVGIPDRRVDEVLDLVGLSADGARRVGGYSLGMRQRLGLAATLLGDPRVLVLDEPANGLDPAGIAWLRSLLRFLAAEGRTVLVSSHMLSEVAQTVDDVVIIAKGRLVHASDLPTLQSMATHSVEVRTPEPERLAAAIERQGGQVLRIEPVRDGVDPATAPAAAVGLVAVAGSEPADAGRVAAAAGVPVYELGTRGRGLEQVFLDLVDAGDGA